MRTDDHGITRAGGVAIHTGGARTMTIARGMWIATVANRRAQRLGEDSVQALTWVQEWVDTKQGAYRALDSPDGAGDDGLLRWLEERNPFREQAHG